VRAHIPVDLQTALSGRSFETYSVGCAPGYKGGILLMNPNTKRTIVRRTFRDTGVLRDSSAVWNQPVELECFEDQDTSLRPQSFDINGNLIVDSVSPLAVSSQTNGNLIVNTNRFGALSDSSLAADDSVAPIDLDDVVHVVDIAAAVPTIVADLLLPAVSAGAVNSPLQRKKPKKGKNSRDRVSPDINCADTFRGLGYTQLNGDVNTLPPSDLPMDLSDLDKLARNSPLAKLTARLNNIARRDGKRVITPNRKYAGNVSLTGIVVPAVPKSYGKALRTAEHAYWRAALKSELQSLYARNTFKHTDVPLDITQLPKNQLVHAKIVLDIKINPDGSFQKYKIRIVARGDEITRRNSGDPNLARAMSDDNYAGCVKSESVRILLAVAAEMDLEIESWDVKTAFLYPDLDPNDVLYLVRPHGLTDADMPPVLQLQKCIYGLPQAAAYFREHSDSALKSIGMVPTISDPQVYTMTRDGKTVRVAAHVDDFGVVSECAKLKQYVFTELSKIYELSATENMSYFTGNYIQRDRANKTITISQPHYAREILSKFDIPLDDGTSTHIYPPTPMVIDLSYTNGHRTTAEEDPVILSGSDCQKYMSKIGSLLYLAIQTRPDILYAVAALSRYCKAPTAEYMEAVDRILWYLAGTADLGLTLHSGEGIVLYATVDASYACHKDLKSHTGCTLHIGRNSASIMTMTKKQSITADSSTVAEYIATHLASKQILWARNFLQEIGFPQTTPTVLMEDNKSTISLIKNKGYGFKTKHIELRYNIIRELVQRQFIVMEYLPTEEMISDMLTKALGPSLFIHLRAKLLGMISRRSSHESKL